MQVGDDLREPTAAQTNITQTSSDVHQTKARRLSTASTFAE